MKPVKKIVGIVEKITIKGKKDVDCYALFDSGAKQTSIDTTLASEALLGPIIATKAVRQSSMRHGTLRPVVNANIRIKGRIYKAKVNVQDRSHMKFPVIIGRNVNRNFLIDTAKNIKLLKKYAGSHQDGNGEL